MQQKSDSMPGVQTITPLRCAGVAPAAVTPSAGFEPSLTAVSQAQKFARQAASALGFEDVQTAVQNLTDALRLLTAP